ncbi:unnamed protein product [Symbiodinium microadriaticum]|nr:unnamed protein product [Symbiodinium microadriaticum]
MSKMEEVKAKTIASQAQVERSRQAMADAEKASDPAVFIFFISAAAQHMANTSEFEDALAQWNALSQEVEDWREVVHSPVMSSENSHIDSAADVSPFTRLGHILNTQQIDEHAESWGADGEEAESLLESLPEETPRLERRAEPSSPFSKRLTSGTIGSTTNGRRTAAKSSPEMSRAAMQARLQSRMVAPAGEDTQEAPLQDLRAMAIRMGPRIEFLHEKASPAPASRAQAMATAVGLVSLRCRIQIRFAAVHALKDALDGKVWPAVLQRMTHTRGYISAMYSLFAMNVCSPDQKRDQDAAEQSMMEALRQADPDLLHQQMKTMKRILAHPRLHCVTCWPCGLEIPEGMLEILLALDSVVIDFRLSATQEKKSVVLSAHKFKADAAEDAAKAEQAAQQLQKELLAVRYGTPGHLALSMASFGPPLLCSGYALLNDKAFLRQNGGAWRLDKQGIDFPSLNVKRLFGMQPFHFIMEVLRHLRGILLSQADFDKAVSIATKAANVAREANNTVEDGNRTVKLVKKLHEAVNVFYKAVDHFVDSGFPGGWMWLDLTAKRIESDPSLKIAFEKYNLMVTTFLEVQKFSPDLFEQDMSVCEFYAGCLCTPRPLPEFDAKCGSGLWEKARDSGVKPGGAALAGGASAAGRGLKIFDDLCRGLLTEDSSLHTAPQRLTHTMWTILSKILRNHERSALKGSSLVPVFLSGARLPCDGIHSLLVTKRDPCKPR